VVSAIERGDFDGNGQLDVRDIDLLNTIIVNSDQEERFDITEDGSVGIEDLQMWVHDLKQTWFGDANLDGEFNSGDLVTVLAAGTYESDADAGWGSGDFDGSGRFDSGDLVLALSDGGYEQGPRAAAVPEPTAVISLLTALIALASVSKCRRSRA
jgi:hypothetical protein